MTHFAYLSHSVILFLNLCDFMNGLSAPAVKVLDSNVNVGEDATINCTYEIFDGRRLYAVLWSNCTSTGNDLNNLINSATDFSLNGRYSIDTSQVNVAILTISNALLSDDGYYQCTVTDSGIYVNNNFARLRVQYLDEIKIDVSSTDDQNVIITCSVNGYPIPQLKLYNEDTIIMTGTTILIYTIDIITESDGGSYRCEASNIADAKTSIIIILDYYTPTIALVRDITVGPEEDIVTAPKVSANPNDVTYKWVTSPPGINDTDNDPATFTFRVSEVVGTNYTVTVTVTNIGSATSPVKITVQMVGFSQNFGVGSGRPRYNVMTVGIFFAGIFVGVFGVIFGLICYNKIKQKTHVNKEDKAKGKQNTYMEYRSTGNAQIYQDLHLTEEETAYVNVQSEIQKNKVKE